MEAPDYNKACEFGRLSGIADQADGIQMLGRFADSVRYAQQLMTTGIVITEPGVLKKAIEDYADSKVRESWQGGGDPENIPLIGEELKESCVLLKDLTGLEFV